MDYEGLLQLAGEAVAEASSLVMDLYKRPVMEKSKVDGSPLTLADLTSQQCLIQRLAASNLPVVSEESASLLLDATCYWLVDPLDGTKDFLAGNDEFTINIALIKNQHPVLAVMAAPALRETYYALRGKAPWRYVQQRFQACPVPVLCQKRRQLHSRFHDHYSVQEFARINQMSESFAVGAALKFARLAWSDAEIYFRPVGTSEWDTAAGQLILECAGGECIDLGTRQTLCYGKQERRNGPFAAFRSPYQLNDFVWDVP